MTRPAFAALLLALVACLCLSAQTASVKANIPFEFRMGTVVMPAGPYLIHQSGVVLTLHTQSGKAKSALIKVYPTRRFAGPASALIFNRYGDHYFLARVRIASSGLEQAASPSPAEKELMSRVGLVQTAHVKLRPR